MNEILSFILLVAAAGLELDPALWNFTTPYGNVATRISTCKLGQYNGTKTLFTVNGVNELWSYNPSSRNYVKLVGDAQKGKNVDGNSSTATFDEIRSLAVDSNEQSVVYAATQYTIRKIDFNRNEVTTIVGYDATTCYNCSQAIDGYGSRVKLDPEDIVFYNATSLYFVDLDMNSVRTVDPITRFSSLYSGNVTNSGTRDGYASNALYTNLISIALDAVSNRLFVAGGNRVIRALNLTSNIVTTIVGDAGSSSLQDGIGTHARLTFSAVKTMAVDSRTTPHFLYFSQTYSIRVVDLHSMEVMTIVRDSFYKTDGMGDVATVTDVRGISLDHSLVTKTLYFTDYDSGASIRKMALSGTHGPTVAPITLSPTATTDTPSLSPSTSQPTTNTPSTISPVTMTPVTTNPTVTRGSGSTTTNTSNMGTAVIIAIVVAGSITLAVGICICKWRLSSREDNVYMLFKEDYVYVHKKKDVEIESKIGKGHFAEAWKVTVKLGKERRPTPAVLKMPKERRNITELESLYSLWSNQHNILRFLGIVQWDDGWFYLLTEYCAKGSLDKLPSEEKDRLIEEKRFGRVVQDVMSGLAYLHGRRMIHRDVACRNLFMRKDDTVIVGDFGLACSADSKRSDDQELPLAWMPPEHFDDNTPTNPQSRLKADVWSAGVAFWEILTKMEKEPFGELKGMQMPFHEALGEELKKKRPLKVPEIVVKRNPLSRFVGICMVHDVTKRPSSDAVLRQIQMVTGDSGANEDGGASKGGVGDGGGRGGISSHTDGPDCKQEGASTSSTRRNFSRYHNNRKQPSDLSIQSTGGGYHRRGPVRKQGASMSSMKYHDLKKQPEVHVRVAAAPTFSRVSSRDVAPTLTRPTSRDPKPHVSRVSSIKSVNSAQDADVGNL